MTGRRLLVVDDEEDIRAVAGMSLELVGGWAVSFAGTGAEAIARAGADPPDAILLDVMMPGLDGPATFARLQAQATTRAVPVILLSAKVQPADLRRFADLGVAGVLPKPFDPMLLPGQVSDALGWS